MSQITKVFGATVANDRVDFDLRTGEIHALLGENGAGKTTLMRVLYGMAPPDSGEIWVDGTRVTIDSPHRALELGIGMVHQHFMLVPTFTVAQNVALGSPLGHRPVFRRRQAEDIVRRAGEEYGIDVDASASVDDIPVETRQRVEILRLLYRGADILVLDEPTSVLGPAQIQSLFATLEKLRRLGKAVVIVTHKLSEVMQIADRVTVLRHGRRVTVVTKGSYDERRLAEAMTGAQLERLPERTVTAPHGVPRLRAVDLVARGAAGQTGVDGISLDVRPGEILGVAGVAGNGQSELVYALAGVLDVTSGDIELDGRSIVGDEPQRRKASGLGVVPDDRHRWGLALDMTVADNLALVGVAVGDYGKRGLFRVDRLRSRFRELLEEFDVRPPDPGLLAGSLSGGNQQKVVLARELSRRPRALVAANPTQGLDVAAAGFVDRRLMEARDDGTAILLVSNDLDQLATLADRIIVLFRGRIAYQASAVEASRDAIALAMAGTTQPGAGYGAGALEADGIRRAAEG